MRLSSRPAGRAVLVSQQVRPTPKIMKECRYLFTLVCRGFSLKRLHVKCGPQVFQLFEGIKFWFPPNFQSENVKLKFDYILEFKRGFDGYQVTGLYISKLWDWGHDPLSCEHPFKQFLWTTLTAVGWLKSYAPGSRAHKVRVIRLRCDIFGVKFTKEMQNFCAFADKFLFGSCSASRWIRATSTLRSIPKDDFWLHCLKLTEPPQKLLLFLYQSNFFT